MKNYLELVSVSAKFHRKENRRTIWCIIMAVFLVVSIFSMTEMIIRMEKSKVRVEYGNWHIMVKNIQAVTAEEIANQPNVKTITKYDVENFHLDKDYNINNKKAVICGADKSFFTRIFSIISEGTFPSNNEVLLSNNAKTNFSYKVGDKVELNTPHGVLDYTISGFCDISAAKITDAIYVVMNPVEWEIFTDFELLPHDSVYYIQFREGVNFRASIDEIKDSYHLSSDSITENTPLLAVLGMSNNTFVINMYMISVLLFMIVLISATLMISGTINSGVAKRTRFFGLLRCIGMSKSQVGRYVKLEALNWCGTAIPIGCILGVLVTWTICMVLKYVIRGAFL